MTASDMEKATATESTSPKGKEATTTSPVKTDKQKEALEHLVAGKRHLLVKDLEPAVSSLAQACELLSAEYGETSYECADAYYYYGKALLEMARAEAGVFGNALDGVPEGEDSDNSQVEDPDKMTEEEREDVEKKVGEALDDNFSALEEKRKSKEKSTTEDETEEDEEEDEDKDEKEGEAKEGETKEGAASSETKEESSTKDAETKDKDAEMKDVEAEKEKAEENVADKGTEEADKAAQEAEDEEDPSNLQLAWEMLELAKVAYNHKLEKCTPEEKNTVETKVCETLLTLGEVSLESENYEQACQDIADCLEKRKKLYAEDSRRIAETHYHLGVALGHFNKFDEAVVALESAIKVLKLRIDNLDKKTESKDESKAGDAFYTREAEVAELKALIPEIEEKIQDTKDMKEQAESGKEENGFGGSSNGSGSAKPISTISIKRKAEGGSDSISPKKAHVTNGDSKA
eukprot:TRINITY_DN3_c0_g1_i12.p1 TRINITY_DN3_c0_g1~~TRINITY_DN3_c0_g1_i12.p1  ORF type:complete len:473 (+),score=213.12 TRINITY_DN3_c0_g1_i12:36-1421(+)